MANSATTATTSPLTAVHLALLSMAGNAGTSALSRFPSAACGVAMEGWNANSGKNAMMATIATMTDAVGFVKLSQAGDALRFPTKYPLARKTSLFVAMDNYSRASSVMMGTQDRVMAAMLFAEDKFPCVQMESLTLGNSAMMLILCPTTVVQTAGLILVGTATSSPRFAGDSHFAETECSLGANSAMTEAGSATMVVMRTARYNQAGSAFLPTSKGLPSASGITTAEMESTTPPLSNATTAIRLATMAA